MLSLLFRHHSNSIAPKTIESRFPCAPSHSFVLFYLPPVEAARFWLVVVFFLRRFAAIKATTYVYFCLFFPLSSPPQTTAKCPPHTFHHGLTPSLISPPSRTPIFGWLMCPPIKRRPPMVMAPSPSLLFFVEYFDGRTDVITPPPDVPPRSHALPNNPPHR